MPHRIYFVTEAEFTDPLQHYGDVEFVLDFEDAAQVLRLWRNVFLRPIRLIDILLFYFQYPR